MAILTVTLNPCVDKTYTVSGFALDCVHRPTGTVVTAGGKGINVARVWRALGGEVKATGFLGGSNGEYLRQAMIADGIAPAFVRVVGESRVCIAIMDPLNGTQTELNENGPTVTQAEADALLQKLRELLPLSHAVIISGSMPPGTPSGLCAEIIRVAQGQFGVKAFLDTSGDALAVGASAGPYLLKPNVHELAALDIDAQDLGHAAKALQTKYGCTLALVTDGPRGAVLAGEDGLWEAVPPQITVASAVGSGDSLTAAFVWALQNGYTEGEALRLGVAAGAANATTYGAGLFPRALVFEMAERVVLNKWSDRSV